MPTRQWIAAALAAVVAVVLPPHTAAAATAPGVTPSLETPSLFDDDEGGNADADDPAIWVDHRRPERSLVIATANAGTPARLGCSVSSRGATGSAITGSTPWRCRPASASRTALAGSRATSRASARRSKG